MTSERRRRRGEVASSPSAKKEEPPCGTGVRVNLQSIMERESDDRRPSVEDETEELEDAYRMAVAFGSSCREENEAPVRETMERRLDVLVQKVNAAENGNAPSCSLNIDGARSYLESLLRILVHPPDPNVWLRLMRDSRGKETPIMLRRGRTLLVSYLVGMKCPGWKDYANILESSPVPSYLGFLSPKEQFQPKAKKKEHTNAMNRSSYFLPAADIGDTTIPPSPIVTEVGLSLCVKKFLHKDAPEGNVRAYQASARSPGVPLFRNFGPLKYSKSSSDENGNLICSIAAPLPDANEVARDLFDLTLRLATDDDSEHDNMPISLRLTTPSASESLQIILQVVSDHLDWLAPNSIVSRYRFILGCIFQTFHCSGEKMDEKVGDDSQSDDDGFLSWSQRASCIICTAKPANRGQMALYTTQFMMLLCTRERSSMQKSFHSAKQPHFYACLQLRQSSTFWEEIDKTANYSSSNTITRVLGLKFCVNLLLPLSFQCALLLASSSNPPIQNKNTSVQSQVSHSALSLITIFCSVLDVLSRNGFLHDCIHVGWAVQMLLFTVSHFVFGEDSWREGAFSLANGNIDSLWEHVAYRLNRLYNEVWRSDWQKLNNQTQSPEPDSNHVYYETIGNEHNDTRMVVLMPSFELYASCLIKFACNLRLSDESSNGVKNFCKFVAKKVFDCYAQAIEPTPFSEKEFGSNVDSCRNEFCLVSSWIGLLVSNLQEISCRKKLCYDKHGRNRGEMAEESSTARIISDLFTPMLECIHLKIMKRVVHSTTLCQKNDCFSEGGPSTWSVATIFLDLYKQEVENFLKKPSPAKTRRWGVYRMCLEKLFGLTPPKLLLACFGHPTLSEYSTEVLQGIWNQYGQCDISNSILIMIAAGMHVNASATYLSSNRFLERHNIPSMEVKRQYKSISSCAKNCIINTFECFNAKEKKCSQSLTNFNNLVRSVRRELSVCAGAGDGLAWWHEISTDLFSLLIKQDKQKFEHRKSKKTVTSRDIAKAFSNLQNDLSTISAISGNDIFI